VGTLIADSCTLRARSLRHFVLREATTEISHSWNFICFINQPAHQPGIFIRTEVFNSPTGGGQVHKSERYYSLRSWSIRADIRVLMFAAGNSESISSVEIT